MAAPPLFFCGVTKIGRQSAGLGAAVARAALPRAGAGFRRRVLRVALRQLLRQSTGSLLRHFAAAASWAEKDRVKAWGHDIILCS